MEDSTKTASSLSHDRLSREAPRLVTVLKEMKEGLDNVSNKLQFLTAKVKENTYPTSNGMSYLEAKNMLLINYCQSLVYYLLSKAKGLSIQGHPVVQSLVETRLFLEKVRPIDKKLQYQIQKLTRTKPPTEEGIGLEKKDGESQSSEDLLRLRPNPDMLLSKDNQDPENTGVYRPPRFAPMEDKKSKRERNAERKEKYNLHQASQEGYFKDIFNQLEGKPEEVTETVGAESIEMARYTARLEDRAKQEEDQFNRVPLSKAEKQKMKHLRKSRNGLRGLTEDFFEEIKALPIESKEPEQSTIFNGARSKNTFNKRKKALSPANTALLRFGEF